VSADRVPAQSAENGHHVLVVDDDASIRTIFARVLDNAGIDVIVADDGERALDISKTDIRNLVNPR